MRYAFVLAFPLVVTIAVEVFAQDYAQGVRAYRAGEVAKSIAILAPLAAQGYAGDQFTLAGMDRDDKDVVEEDVEAAKSEDLGREQRRRSRCV